MHLINTLYSSHISDISWVKENFEDGFKVIGKGGFGEVLLAKRKGSNKESAIKVVETLDPKTSNECYQEVLNLKRLKNHVNIMSYNSEHMNKITLSTGRTL